MEVEPARILLVEDDPLNVELLQLSLSQCNFVNQIDILEDGEQALEYLLGREGNPPNYPLPDLVLLDLRLPKISGVQVLEAIRAATRTRNLVVVVLTSSEENNELTTCYQLGVSSHVVKPLNYETFINVVYQIGLHWMLLKQPPVLLP